MLRTGGSRGRKLDNLTSRGRWSVCECKQLCGCPVPVRRGILECHGAVLGDEGLTGMGHRGEGWEVRLGYVETALAG